MKRNDKHTSGNWLLWLTSLVGCIVRMPTISIPVPQFVRWRQRGARGSGGLGDMELGRRGVVFDNRIIFDVSGTGFDNLTYGNQPRVICPSTVLDTVWIQSRITPGQVGISLTFKERHYSQLPNNFWIRNWSHVDTHYYCYFSSYCCSCCSKKRKTPSRRFKSDRTHAPTHSKIILCYFQFSPPFIVILW